MTLPNQTNRLHSPPDMNPFTGYFNNRQQETLAEQALWPSQSGALRIPLIIFSLIIVGAGYLDYVHYQLSLHFWSLLGLRLLLAALAACIYKQSYQRNKPKHFDSLMGIFQFYILCFFFALFYDRWFLSGLPSVSETFYTVLFISYPLLACYVFPSRLWTSLLLSMAAFAIYVTILIMLPETQLHYHVTELITCGFFVYYAYHLMKSRHQDLRQVWLYQQHQQQSLAQAVKASQDKSRFIAATSHDLRQPLHSLGIYNELLKQQHPSPYANELLLKSGRAIDSLSQYFEALIDISRLDSGTLKPTCYHFELAPLLAKVAEDLAPLALKQQITLKVITTKQIVFSDPNYLGKVVEQLVKNALLHSKANKVILGVRRRADRLELQVWDNGQGIPADKSETIFDEFSQLANPERNRNKGLGLGLALAKKISNLLKLKLTLDSEPARYTVFRLQLQYGDKGQLTQAGAHAKCDQVANSQCILLVDDDEMVLEAMISMLESWQYQVISSSSPEGAIQLMRAHQVDAIISDYNLPGSYNGPSLLTTCNQVKGSQIPAIILTGDINIPVQHNHDETGYILLHKPVKGAQLRIALNKIVNKYTQST
ncbi:ATP-binding response regulator [Motilimonas eburnea]|uniref:ATP-binding response regulator n=1 Tax=Motilimonas eburnea TaxID=1737488 RepID=UPI001E40B2E9|nr:hybrid sensor histidine kinase/response regulator [Motilimonas eburnea]MCE2572769.1 hybrid sensor histidine kinase/response regulator [Motilimonas eburnea]